MKKIYIVGITVLFLMGIAIAQLGSFEKEIKPKPASDIPDPITVCWEWDMEPKTDDEPECRSYPGDAAGILKEQVRKDIKNWYKEDVPEIIEQTSVLKNVCLISTNYKLAEQWIGHCYNFESDELVKK